jgi:fluoroacetyl-CoA thioesterase
MSVVEAINGAHEGDVMSLIGKTAEVRLRAIPPGAAENHTLSPEDGFPADLVHSALASSRLMGLMELAAARLMQAQLPDGHSSVSVEMNVTHLVAATLGEQRAVATYLGTNGRLHHFRVHAFDESGLIGSAEHTRAVVVPGTLRAGARRRAGRPAMLLNV